MKFIIFKRIFYISLFIFFIILIIKEIRVYIAEKLSGGCEQLERLFNHAFAEIRAEAVCRPRWEGGRHEHEERKEQAVGNY